MWETLSIAELEAWRQVHGLSPVSAAKALGVGLKEYWRWRRGRAAPDLETQARLEAIVTGAAAPLEPGPREREHDALVGRLHECRTRLGLTYTDLAEHIGVGRSHLSQWLTGAARVPLRWRQPVREALESLPKGSPPVAPPPPLPPAVPTARQLRGWRVTHGLSLDDLAERLGGSPAAISRWENGWTRPGPEKATLLLHGVYGVTADDLRAFGRSLVEWRKRQRLSRTELARRAGTSVGVVLRRWEGGAALPAEERDVLEAALTELSGQRPTTLEGTGTPWSLPRRDLPRLGDPRRPPPRSRRKRSQSADTVPYLAISRIVSRQLESRREPLDSEQLARLVRRVRRSLTLA